MTLDPELVNFFLDEAKDLLSEWERICLELEQNETQEKFNSLFRIAHNIKGSSRAVGLVQVGEFIHKVEDVIVSVRDGKMRFSMPVLAMFLDAQSCLDAMFSALRQNPETKIPVEHFYLKHKSVLETDSESHDKSSKASAVEDFEILIPESTPSQKPHALQEEPKKDLKASASMQETHKAPQKDEVLRVSTRKIDNLLSLIGELSIQQSILENALSYQAKEHNPLLQSSLTLSRKLTKEIYNTAFDLRMTPVGGIYQRLERAIKDLARDVNKNIEVELLGSEVEIEKTILDKLLDPLTHIVRNSVDHGIEPADVRASCGKNLKGKVTIAARKEGDGVEIIIKDDGKGLNRQRILEKAVEKGIVKNPETLSQDEIFGLIFLPGFSTAEKVTNISGRGVGMDVVMRTIEEVDGRISIASEEGKGTKFKISIPTSLSIVESLIVQIGGASYVLPINCLEEVLEIKGEELQWGQSVYLYRGKTIPFLHLGEILGNQSGGSELGSIPILVTKVQGKRLALGVDFIMGQHQSVVRNLNPYFDQSFAISGGTILPSGEPGLILNISAIVEKFYKSLVISSEAAA